MRFTNCIRSVAICVVVLTLCALSATPARAVDPWGLKPGNVELKSAGALVFGPAGILFVGDTAGGAVYAIATGDQGARSAGELSLAGLSAQLAQHLGVAEADLKVNDLAVNPETGHIYLSVAAGKPARGAIVGISSDGTLKTISLENVPHARAELTDVPDSAVGRRGDPRDDAITDLAYRDGKLLVAGLAKGESPSTVREFAFPFAAGATATKIEIFHAAHGRVEDHAVVRTFVPLVIDEEPVVLAGFTCTPLVRFPISALEAGNKVRGTTVAELGNRNRPLDMIVYEKNGQRYILMANSARGVMKISLANVRENPGLTEPVRGGGTAGQTYETIAELAGVEQLDKLDDAHGVILAKNADGSLDLRTIALP
ncbi:MAG: hypothetical protein K2Y37_26775 [Pirellulales bacterium]|nr:hypothetical protein [Pirellulales bacterium]